MRRQATSMVSFDFNSRKLEITQFSFDLELINQCGIFMQWPSVQQENKWTISMCVHMDK